MTYEYEIDGEQVTGTLADIANALRHEANGECVKVTYPFYLKVERSSFNDDDYATVTLTDTLDGRTTSFTIDGRA